jgi:hypothetical protein
VTDRMDFVYIDPRWIACVESCLVTYLIKQSVIRHEEVALEQLISCNISTCPCLLACLPAGASACTLCPAGSYISSTGSTSLLLCHHCCLKRHSVKAYGSSIGLSSMRLHHHCSLYCLSNARCVKGCKWFNHRLFVWLTRMAMT